MTASPQPGPQVDDVTTGLTEIFRDVFAEPAMVLREDMTMSDIAGWDSIRMVVILLAVEERFGTTLRAAEVRRIRSVGDLARLARGGSA